MRYTTIFFDLDDTLLDTAGISRESLEEIYFLYSFNNYYPVFEDFYQVYSPHNLSLWKDYEKNLISKQDIMSKRFWIPFRHMDGMNKKKALEINNDFMYRTAGKSRLITGAKEVLDALKRFCNIYMVSNGFEEVQYKKVKQAGLQPYFEKIILSDQVGINKPDRAIFNHALKEAGADKKEVIMIGDNWNTDIIGAKFAGIDQIWYNPGKEAPREFIPTYTVNMLTEIKDILLPI